MQCSYVLEWGSFRLSIVVADLLCPYMLYYAYQYYKQKKLPSLAIKISILVFASFSFSLIWGIYSLGYVSTWSFYNKYLSLPILFCYAFYASCFQPAIIIKCLLKSYSILALFIIFFQTILHIHSIYAGTYGVLGFLANPNAFGFLALFVLIYQISVFKNKPIQKSEIFINLILIFSTQSRAVFINAGFILIFFILLKRLSWVEALKFWIYAWLSYVILMDFIYYLKNIYYSNFSIHLLSDMGIHHQFSTTGTVYSSDSERIRMFTEGLKAWWEAGPVAWFLGLGLGYFREKLSQGYAVKNVVIHNTGLWIWVEMGILGFFSLLAAYGLFIKKYLWDLKKQLTNTENKNTWLALLACQLVFAIFSMVHEMLSQRILWLNFGMILAFYHYKRHEKNISSI